MHNKKGPLPIQRTKEKVYPAPKQAHTQEQAQRLEVHMNNIPVMLGIKETATNWNITPNYARSLALSGKVAAVRVGRGKILINQQSVADYFSSSHLSAESCNTDTDNIAPIPVKV